jgi:hypothetical protein
MSTAGTSWERTTGEGLSRLDREMAELVLLLPAGQAADLERAARRRGLTAAQLTRSLIRAFLAPSAALDEV